MQTGSTMNSSANRAAQNANKAVGDVATSVSEQAAEFGEKFSRAKEQLISAVSEEAQVASDFTKNAVKQIPALMETIEGNIRKHPFIAAGIALGLGALAVNLLTRERRHRD